MQRQIIKPQFDQPLTVKLDFGAEGIQRDGKFGIEYQYTLNDDSCVMWLPKQGRDALLRTNAQAGDYVQLVKTRRGTQHFYEAQVLSDTYEAEEPEPEPVRSLAPRPQASALQQSQQRPIRHHQAQQPQPPQQQAPQGNRRPQQKGNEIHPI